MERRPVDCALVQERFHPFRGYGDWNLGGVSRRRDFNEKARLPRPPAAMSPPRSGASAARVAAHLGQRAAAAAAPRHGSAGRGAAQATDVSRIWTSSLVFPHPHLKRKPSTGAGNVPLFPYSRAQ